MARVNEKKLESIDQLSEANALLKKKLQRMDAEFFALRRSTKPGELDNFW